MPSEEVMKSAQMNATPVASSPYQEAVQVIEIELERLSDAINRLTVRLGPVLSPEIPSAPMTVGPPQAETPVALVLEGLASITNRLRLHNVLLDELHSRVVV
jgi:hypothetical protein